MKGHAILALWFYPCSVLHGIHTSPVVPLPAKEFCSGGTTLVSHHHHCLAVKVSTPREILLSGRTSAMCSDVFGCPTSGGGAVISWAEVTEAASGPCGAQQPPPRRITLECPQCRGSEILVWGHFLFDVSEYRSFATMLRWLWRDYTGKHREMGL